MDTETIIKLSLNVSMMNGLNPIRCSLTITIIKLHNLLFQHHPTSSRRKVQVNILSVLAFIFFALN